MNQDTNNFTQQGNNELHNIQNQNIEQNANINNQQMFSENNNIYQQPVNQNNIPSSNSNNGSSKQNKTKIIGIVAAVVVVVLFVFIMLFRGGSSSNGGGHTVDYGKTLEINEMNGYYDFDINVLSIEKDYSINSWFYNGDCYALKVSIKNNSTSSLSLLSLVNFTLINSSNNKIAGLNMGLSSTIDGSIEKEIPSGESASGYLYFYNVDMDGNTSNIDDSDISKLKISVPKELNNSNGTVTGEYNDYYISLK